MAKRRVKSIRVLNVCQNKGGVGKTTVARHIAEGMARRGYRTCVADFDPQGNVSQRLLKMEIDDESPDGVSPPLHPEYDPAETPEWSGRSGSAAIFVDPYGAVPYPCEIENLWVLPADGRKLRGIELVTKEETKKKVHDVMFNWVNLPEVQELFDLIVIDTAPSKGPLATAAMRSATHIVMPCEMETQSIEGLRGMLALWRQENRGRTDPIKIVGILPNKFRKNITLHEGLLESLRSDALFGPLMAPFTLGLRTAIAESDHPEAKPQSVFDLPDSHDAKRESLLLLDWMEKGLEL